MRIGLLLLLAFFFPLPGFATEDWRELIRKDSPAWTIAFHRTGDLNRDGRSDVVAVLSRPRKDEPGKEASFWIFLAQKDGDYRLHTRSDRAVCFGCGGAKIPPDMVVGTPTIHATGVLWIKYFGGSRITWEITMKWRLDPSSDRFTLIGSTAEYSDALADYGAMEPGQVRREDINFATLRALRTVQGEGTFACRVRPPRKALTLAEFDFANSGPLESHFIPGSCKRVRTP